jgi:hypothetical protein
MPLVLDAASHSLEQLRRLLDQQREGLLEILPMLQTPPESYPDPVSLRTAADLVTDALVAVDRLSGPTADRSDLAAAVNLAYAADLAALDLRKTHSGGPTVPRSRARPKG